jgi:hypothetical protein
VHAAVAVAPAVRGSAVLVCAGVEDSYASAGDLFSYFPVSVKCTSGPEG